MKILLRVECDTVRAYKLKKGPRQMVSVHSRLYRTDDRFMIKDRYSEDCYCIYNIDDTQPYLCHDEIIDPDFTKALIDSAKLAGNKKGIWAGLNPSKAWEWLTVAIVCGALLYSFLVQGGM